MTLTDVEASFYRYLYENLEVPYDIRILEDITLQEYDGLSKWVVIDSLPNTLGVQPKQMYFLHIATQKAMKNAKEELLRLVDQVLAVIKLNTVITVYNYDTGEEIGGMLVSERSLGPVMPHFSGGTFRSLTVGVVYAAEQ